MPRKSQGGPQGVRDKASHQPSVDEPSDDPNYVQRHAPRAADDHATLASERPRRKPRRPAPVDLMPTLPELDESEEENDPSLDEEGRQSLPSYKPQIRKFGELVRWMDDGGLKLDPDYQREVVWTDRRQTNLIQSINEGFPIPMIILNQRKLGKQPGRRDFARQYICIDGRQRLEAIARFVKGEIPGRAANGAPLKWFRDDGSGSPRQLLTPDEQRKFREQSFTSFEYRDLTEKQEMYIFHRINEGGVALKRAEIKRSQAGNWQDLARSYEREFPKVLELCNFQRGSEFTTLVRTFAQILECDQGNGSKILLRHDSYLFKRPELCTRDVKKQLRQIFEIYEDLAKEHSGIFKPEWIESRRCGGRKTFAPIEFIAVAVLIDQHGDLSVNELAQAIGEMRVVPRREGIALRNNVVAWTSLWTFILELGDAEPGEADTNDAGSSSGSEPPSLNPGGSLDNNESQDDGRLADRPSTKGNNAGPTSQGSSSANKAPHDSASSFRSSPQIDTTPGSQSSCTKAWDNLESARKAVEAATKGTNVIRRIPASVDFREPQSNLAAPPTPKSPAEQPKGAPIAVMTSKPPSQSGVQPSATASLAAGASTSPSAGRNVVDLHFINTFNPRKEPRSPLTSPNKRPPANPLRDNRSGKRPQISPPRDKMAGL